MSVRVDVDATGLDRRFSGEAQRRRQVEFAMRAALLMRRYVPLGRSRTAGTLRNSEPVASQYERGLLVWNTPYAHRQYVHDEYRHTEPGATAHWDRTMRAHDSEALRQYAAALIAKG